MSSADSRRPDDFELGETPATVPIHGDVFLKDRLERVCYNRQQLRQRPSRQTVSRSSARVAIPGGIER
jgi:hypothetical protein